MQKHKLFLLAVLSLQTAVFSQSDKYVTAMKKNLALFDSAEDFTNLSNAFERIGDAEKTQWLPYYYAGLALAVSGWTSAVTDKDANAGRINAFCDKAESIANKDADKAEILTLRNMSATQQMISDPLNSMPYAVAADQAMENAMKLDPNNPRLYYLKGMSVLSTPEPFGGGKEKAKPVFEKAVELYKGQTPKELYPSWGLKQAEDMIAQCK